MSDELNPITREETYLAAIAEGGTTDLKPITRKEKYLAYIAGQDITPPKPITREERLLAQIVPGSSSSEDQTYIVVDENGTEVAAVATGEKVELTATANDIRIGTTAVTDDGVIEGTKEIPAYHTTEGYELIESGSAFAIQFGDELYDFTKLQVIICPWAGSIAGSVAAEKVSLDENIYAVNSSESIAVVSRNSERLSIDLNITNESENRYLVRYFTYKEIV